MQAMCVPYNDESKYPGWYAVCLKQTTKFHKLAQISQKPFSSPTWCVDNCVPQKGSPEVALQA